MTRDPKPGARYVYSGQQVLAVVEPFDDGRWRLVVRRRLVGIFDTYGEAIEALDREGDEL